MSFFVASLNGSEGFLMDATATSSNQERKAGTIFTCGDPIIGKV